MSLHFYINRFSNYLYLIKHEYLFFFWRSLSDVCSVWSLVVIATVISSSCGPCPPGDGSASVLSLCPAWYLVSYFLPLHLGDALHPPHLHRCGLLPPGSLALLVYLCHVSGSPLSNLHLLSFYLFFCLILSIYSAQLFNFFLFGAKIYIKLIFCFIFVRQSNLTMTHVESFLASISSGS